MTDHNLSDNPNPNQLSSKTYISELENGIGNIAITLLEEYRKKYPSKNEAALKLVAFLEDSIINPIKNNIGE